MLDAPFIYFGGKKKIAPLVWQRFGDVKNFVEPFAGSLAVLLKRPQPFEGVETVNDVDGMVSNFWRAIRYAPEETARYADWPVNENDLHARHAWLLQHRDDLPAWLEGDPDWYDARIAGYWCWGICAWIGSGFCSGQGPWHVIDGKLVDTKRNDGDGAWRQLPHLRDGGHGINRQLVHLGNNGRGINRKRVHLGDNGRGINRKRVDLSAGGGHGGGTGQGMLAHSKDVYSWFAALSERLKRVRVCCGDWSRVCGPSVTYKHGLTAVFLDPPYGEEANRANNLYRYDSMTLARDVREWAIENGKREDMRIALCGYEFEHEMPSDWDCVAWNAGEGFGGQAKERSGNGKRERVWFSPACLSAQQMGLGF